MLEAVLKHENVDARKHEFLIAQNYKIAYSLASSISHGSHGMLLDAFQPKDGDLVIKKTRAKEYDAVAATIDALTSILSIFSFTSTMIGLGVHISLEQEFEERFSTLA
jgi:hypothetical protein